MKSLLKFETFQGKKEEWDTYKWELYVAMDVLDPVLRVMLETVEKDPQKDYRLVKLNQLEQQKAKEVFAVLALTCKGTAAPYIKAAESQNGFDAWRRLCRKYQVRSQVALLNRLLHPRFQSSDPRVNLAEWQKELLDYERMSGDMVTDGTKKSIYMTQIAPDVMRHHLQMNQSRLLTSDDVAEEIESFMDAQEEDEQAATGTVGAVVGKTKGKDERKGKGKGQKRKEQRTRTRQAPQWTG